MASLAAALSNVAVPHQPYTIILDDAACPAFPFFVAMIQGCSTRAALLVNCLRSSGFPMGVDTYDVSRCNRRTSGSAIVTDIEERAARLGDRADIYIDAFDTFAEDYGKINAMKLARRLLKITLTRKAPSRLVISIASSSGIYQSLLTPTFCSSLTHIQPLSPDLLRYISHTYLKTVSSDPAFLSLVERALARRLPEYFASHAQKFLTVVMTVRKATGGAKAMLRNVAAFDSETCSVMELDKLLLYDTLGTSSNVPTSRPSTHADLGIPFNLSITDDQRQRRDAIPVPYVHEGEGVELGWEEEEEDDDDEEI